MTVPTGFAPVLEAPAVLLRVSGSFLAQSHGDAEKQFLRVSVPPCEP